jgi:hypothetical protein
LESRGNDYATQGGFGFDFGGRRRKAQSPKRVIHDRYHREAQFVEVAPAHKFKSCGLLADVVKGRQFWYQLRAFKLFSPKARQTARVPYLGVA